MIVVDASALAEYLLQSAKGAQVANRIASNDIHIPHLCTVETASVLRSWARRGEVDSSRASAAIQDLLDFDAIRYPHEPLLPRAWELRENVSAYDAVYVVLAESLNAPILTCDGRLSRAPLPGITIEVISAGAS